MKIHREFSVRLENLAVYLQSYTQVSHCEICKHNYVKSKMRESSPFLYFMNMDIA